MKVSLEHLVEHYRLTTAEIYYRFPDHPSLLQTYLWQDLDMTPDFPRLSGFLNFWERTLDGKLHSVSVVHCGIIKPSEFRFFDGEYNIH